MSIKPTLLSIRQKEHATVTSRQLADVAGLSLGESYAVEIGGFTSQVTAQRVLNAFGILTGRKLNLGDIRFQNIPAQTSSTSQREVPRS